MLADAQSEISLSGTAPGTCDTLILDVQGMKCAGCVGAVERQLRQQVGVCEVRVNLLTGMTSIDCDRTVPISESALTESMTAIGFPTKIRYNPRQSNPDRHNANQPQNPPTNRRFELYWPILKLAIAASLVVISGLGHLGQLGVNLPSWLESIEFHWALATIALLVPGWDILISGWRGLRQGAPNMNTLISLGTLTAYGTSAIAQLFPHIGWECFFDEPVMLIGAIVLGRGLEHKARQRALSTLNVLSARQPQSAHLWCGSISVDNRSASLSPDDVRSQPGQSALDIPITQVRMGDYLHVLAGETIPVDGEVWQGHTTINEAMITGEAIPVDKHPGDRVIAGTLNHSHPILVRTTATGNDTTLSHIIALVETAQTRKAPIQRLADQVAGYFVYGVIGLALVTFLFWVLVGSQIWPQVLTQSPQNVFASLSLSTHHAAQSHPLSLSPLLLSLKLAIAVLVVSCPCALGLATPVAILVGTSRGAEQGLLIRGGDVLERLSQIDTWIFDKTGTLTQGQPQIVDVQVVQGAWSADPALALSPTLSPEQHLLQLAASVEQHTRHPFADALVKAAQEQNLPRLPIPHAQTEVGYGVLGQFNDHLIQIGTWQWLQNHGVQDQSGLLPGAVESGRVPIQAGSTQIYLALDHQVIGCITLKDKLRPDAQSVVQQLQHLGHSVQLLTGDRVDNANDIATQLTLSAEAVIASVNPDQKVAYIHQLQQQGRRVAMVGDGFNDAPALTQADVGITLQSSTDAALASADIVILTNHLKDVVQAFRLSQATLRKVRQNLGWSIAYNLVGIPLAMGCFLPIWSLYLSPATAGAMMSLSSVSVILNSLSLRRLRLEHDF